MTERGKPRTSGQLVPTWSVPATFFEVDPSRVCRESGRTLRGAPRESAPLSILVRTCGTACTALAVLFAWRTHSPLLLPAGQSPFVSLSVSSIVSLPREEPLASDSAPAKRDRSVLCLRMIFLAHLLLVSGLQLAVQTRSPVEKVVRRRAQGAATSVLGWRPRNGWIPHGCDYLREISVKCPMSIL